jgi:hypothetical protein
MKSPNLCFKIINYISYSAQFWQSSSMNHHLNINGPKYFSMKKEKKN